MKIAVALSVGLLVVGSRPAAAAEAVAAPSPDGSSRLITGAMPADSDGEPNELGLTADDYAASLDYDTSYDDSVAQAYDDGYSEDAVESFRAALAPFGTWVDDAAYGEVWVPSEAVVGQDFSPYATNGDWVDTEYGWTWVSGWPWGWAAFHYGRWTTIAGHGWAWVPGTRWGPAWVAWRAGAGCVGWAPLPPRGVALGSPLGARSPWRFVGASNLGRSHGAYLPPSVVPRVFGQMSVVSNARRLGTGAATETVNVGPSLRGSPPVGGGTARLASVAPKVLPRVAVRPRPGLAIESRSWVRAGVTRQLAFGPADRSSETGRPSGLGRAATVMRGVGAPHRETYGTSGGKYGGTPGGTYGGTYGGAYRSYVPIYRRSPSSGTSAWPAAPARASAPAPSWGASWRTSAPRFAAPTAPFTAPTAPFTAPTTGFTGASPSSSTGHSSFGGGAPSRSFGGGHPAFHGGGGRRR